MRHRHRNWSFLTREINSVVNICRIHECTQPDVLGFPWTWTVSLQTEAVLYPPVFTIAPHLVTAEMRVRPGQSTLESGWLNSFDQVHHNGRRAVQSSGIAKRDFKCKGSAAYGRVVLACFVTRAAYLKAPQHSKFHRHHPVSPLTDTPHPRKG